LPVKPDAATPLTPADPDVPFIGVLISTAKTEEEIRNKLPAIKSGAGFFLKGRFFLLGLKTVEFTICT
jgi:hypothetical protein